MKKILIISNYPTHPTFAGNRLMILNYAEYLKSKGNDIYFLFLDEGIQPRDLILTKKYWGNRIFIIKTRTYKWKKRLYKYYRLLTRSTLSYNIDDWFPWNIILKVKKIQAKYRFDVIWTNYIWTSKILSKITCPIKVINTHDVFSYRNEKTGMKWFSTIPKQEAKALNRADFIISVQEEEKIFLQKLTSKKVLTTFCPIKYNRTDIRLNYNILFFSGNNPHNIDGIIYWIKHVYSSLKKEIPQINLLIGGSICNTLSKMSFTNDIQILGEIDDLHAFYDLGDIVINPVFNGTGLKIKTIEALSYNKILVLHPHNIIGLPLLHLLPVCLAKDDVTYSKAIREIICNDEKISIMKNKIFDYMQHYHQIIDDNIAIILKQS